MDFSSLPGDSEITNGCDRLSELPDSLLISILSLLDMSDVVQTTYLSKRWNDLWTTVPCLDFWEDGWRDFVRWALAKWKGAKIHKLRVGFDDPPSSDLVDSVLLLAVEKQAEDLCIFLGNQTDGEVCANQRLYSCSSLTRLSISYFALRVEDSKVEWNQLKSLTIEYVYSFREHDMNQMLSGAPLLEELVLRSTHFNENLHIRSNSLKKLEIGRGDRTCPSSVIYAELRIRAPNLLSLEISACVYGTCFLEVPSLIDVILCFKEYCNEVGYVTDEDLPPLEMFRQVFQSISHVEKVTLSDLCIKLLHNMNAKGMAVQFPNTKFLKLYAGEPGEMLDVLEMFPQLKTLIIELDEDYWYDLEQKKYAFYSFKNKAIFPSLSLFQLKNVEIIWSECDASIFPAIEILLENANLLEKMVFCPESYQRIWCCRKQWLTAKKKVLRMKRSSPTAEVVVIYKGYKGYKAPDRAGRSRVKRRLCCVD